MEYSVAPSRDSLPPDPQLEWQQKLANRPQQLQDQIDEHIEALEVVVIAYDPFDLIASLFCKNALADATLNEVQEDRNDAFTEYLTLLLLTRPSEAYPERGNNELPLEILSSVENYIQTIFRDCTLSIMFRDTGAQVSRMEPPDPWEHLRGQRYCHWTWWIIRPAPANASRAHFSLIRLDREADSSCGPSRPYLAFIFIKPPTAMSRGFFTFHPRSTFEAWHWRQGIRQHFRHCPPSVGSSRCHSWGTLPVTLRYQFATSLSWLHERHP